MLDPELKLIWVKMTQTKTISIQSFKMQKILSKTINGGLSTNDLDGKLYFKTNFAANNLK
jgi:hypothetical protein